MYSYPFTFFQTLPPVRPSHARPQIARRKHSTIYPYAQYFLAVLTLSITTLMRRKRARRRFRRSISCFLRLHGIMENTGIFYRMARGMRGDGGNCGATVRTEAKLKKTKNKKTSTSIIVREISIYLPNSILKQTFKVLYPPLSNMTRTPNLTPTS